MAKAEPAVPVRHFPRDARGRRQFPRCFVCEGEVKDVPLGASLAALRAMNVPVVLTEPGHPRYPEGLVRHSYCAPGTDRWAEHLGTARVDKRWGRVFGYVRRGGAWVREAV